MSKNLATDAADPVDPECVVHCVAFFYEEGKGGEDYRWKNKFSMLHKQGGKETREVCRMHLVSNTHCLCI